MISPIFVSLTVLTALYLTFLYLYQKTREDEKEIKQGFRIAYACFVIFLAGLGLYEISMRTSQKPENFSESAEKLREQTISFHQPPSHPVPKSTGTKEIDFRKIPEVIPIQEQG